MSYFRTMQIISCFKSISNNLALCGYEAGEEGSEALDVPPELGGRGGGDAPQYQWDEGVGQ